MSTPVKNFAKVTVDGGYDASATSVDLVTGHGSRLEEDEFPYPGVWWNATDYADPADDPDREIILINNRTGDTLDPIVRAQEGTSASAKNIAGKTYKIICGVTAAMWDALGDLSLAQTFRGLHLQTHPDSDLAASRVRLVHADAIVMSDGEEVPDWDNVDVDLAAAAGIGGIDTGSEGPSRWYKIFAMWNGVTKGLMAQRAKNYVKDTSLEATEDASQGLRHNVDNSTIRIAQGVQFVSAGPLAFVDIKVVKTGTPTGNVWNTLEANSGGVPSNTPLSTSNKMDVARSPATAGWVRMVFPSPFSVSAATLYHLVKYGDYTVSASNFLSWRMDGSAGGYVNGAKALFDSDTATWTTDTDDDMLFRAYLVENDTPLVVPAGYRYAHIGWAYNDASSNLKHFIQKDRTVFCGMDDAWQVGSLAAAVALVDLFAFVPPVPVVVQFHLQNATASHAAVGVLSATDISATAADERVGTIKASVSAAFNSQLGPIVLDAHQSVMFASSAGTAQLYIASFQF